MKPENYFAFIDETGNSTQDRFFGLGLLMVNDEIGDFYDDMKIFYDKAYEIARNNKNRRIDELRKNNDIEQIKALAQSNKRFELKFINVGFTNNTVYESLVKKYFTYKSLRFCTLVIDREEKEPETTWKPALNPWDAYIQQAAMLISNNVKDIQGLKQVCVLADDLSRPRSISKSFEMSLKDSICYRLKKDNKADVVFGITRLESHASLLLQIVDILLGAVLYDYKKSAGLISETLEKRQEIVVKAIRDSLSTESLAVNKTFHKPSYFSVWRLNKRAGHGQETHTRI